MTLKASLKFAKSLVFPKSEKKSSARKSLFGALLCIGLSIIPLVVVMSISNGMINGMTERIIGLSSSHIQGYFNARAPFLKDEETFLEYSRRFEEIDGVVRAYPEISVTALAAGKAFRTGAELRCMAPDIFEQNPDFKRLFTVVEGSLEDYLQKSSEGNGRVAVIGQKMASDLGLHPGDTFRVITTRTEDGRTSPRLSSFKVCAVVSSGYQELDQLWVFIPISAAYSSLSLAGASFTMMVKTKDAFSPELVRIQRDIDSSLGDYANFYRWNQIHVAEFENFSSTKVMLIFIMMLIVLVASVNVSSAIIMLVMERQREIAILKSIGASPSGITLSFLLTGMACGCGGVLFGLPLGLLASANASAIVRAIESLVNLVSRLVKMLQGIPPEEIARIKLMDPAYYLQDIPFDLPFVQVFLIVAATILLSLVVSVIPSVKAGREKPLEILRKY